MKKAAGRSDEMADSLIQMCCFACLNLSDSKLTVMAARRNNSELESFTTMQDTNLFILDEVRLKLQIFEWTWHNRQSSARWMASTVPLVT